MWPQGRFATVCCTIVSSGQTSAKARIYAVEQIAIAYTRVRLIRQSFTLIRTNQSRLQIGDIPAPNQIRPRRFALAKSCTPLPAEPCFADSFVTRRTFCLTNTPVGHFVISCHGRSWRVMP